VNLKNSNDFCIARIILLIDKAGFNQCFCDGRAVTSSSNIPAAKFNFACTLWGRGNFDRRKTRGPAWVTAGTGRPRRSARVLPGRKTNQPHAALH